MTETPQEWEDVIDYSAPVTKDDIEVEGKSDSGDLVKMADDWYESITEEELKIKMVRRYIVGVTKDHIGYKEANEIMRAHGFDV